MELRVALKAVERAVASTVEGGELELGFFGGEHLLEARFISHIIDYAATLSSNAGITLSCFFTSNGTINNPDALPANIRFFYWSGNKIY